MTECNGWRSWPTWNCYMWMTGTEDALDMWTRRARGLDADEFAQLLRLHFEAAVERIHPEPSFFSDLLYNQLGNTDWREIAAYFTDEEGTT